MASLLDLLPQVQRARDYRLSIEGGKKLVDLWQDGGRAVLGHKPPNMIRELKNAAERGLFSPFHSVYEARFAKALEKMLALKAVSLKIYGSKAALYHALENQGFVPDGIADPAFPDARSSVPLSFWRPFSEARTDSSLLVPVLPWPLSPWVLVFVKQHGECFPQGGQMPAGEIVSPAILAPAARAVHDLIAAETRGRLNYPKIRKALAQPECKWQRQGIYLTRKPGGQDNWNVLWKHFLKGGFLLPPEKADPLILPGELSPGEEAKLAALLLKY